jgi:hypothetical protein
MVAMMSCEKSPRNSNIESSVSDDFKIVGNHFTLVTIDSCEYFYHSSAYGAVLEHKGNCKNTIHLYNE